MELGLRGADMMPFQDWREQRAERRFAQGVEAVERTGGHQRQPRHKLDAGHEGDQVGVAVPRHQPDRRSMVRAQPGQSRFQENKITKLLMKCGVTSGHRGIQPQNGVSCRGILKEFLPPRGVRRLPRHEILSEFRYAKPRLFSVEVATQDAKRPRPGFPF